MEAWVIVGLIVGIVVGFISGAAVTFAYITYRSYKNFVELQNELAKSTQSVEYSGGMSA